jgi:hypothetical protein
MCAVKKRNSVPLSDWQATFFKVVCALCYDTPLSDEDHLLINIVFDATTKDSVVRVVF